MINSNILLYFKMYSSNILYLQLLTSAECPSVFSDLKSGGNAEYQTALFLKSRCTSLANDWSGNKVHS